MLAAVFLWWFSTGAILLVVRLMENHSLSAKLKVCIFSLPILALGLWGIWKTSSSLTILDSYLAFVSALLVWGWIELTFLTGVITGPNKSQCPRNITLFEKFIRAWGTLAYHEISLLLALGIVIFLGYAQGNHFGISYSSDILASLSRNNERTEKLIANTGSKITNDRLDYYKILFSKPDHVKGTLKLMAEWDLSEFLNHLKNSDANINFLVGTLDKTVPISISKKWSQILTKSNYKEIQGAGHLVHEEMPYEVSQSILEQLKAPRV